MGVAWGTCPISNFWDPLNISVSDEATFFKFGVHVNSGLFLPADHKFAPQVGVAWGTCRISNFWDPLNICGSDEATLFKFAAYMDPGLFLSTDHKLAPKWAWPGVRAQFRNFGTPSISLGRMKPRFSNFVRTWRLGCSCTRTTNWPRSGRGLEYVPNFEFLGPPQHLWIA